MKKFLMILGVLLVFGAFNYGIYEKETLLSQGETVYLKLAPVDPRSLMQGDYMRLTYEVTQQLPSKDFPKDPFVVVGLSADHVASFRRLDDGTPLAQDEKKMRLLKRGDGLFSGDFQGRLLLFPEAFFFQEGQGETYAQAKYGVFKVSATGEHLLIGLADDKHTLLSAQTHP